MAGRATHLEGSPHLSCKRDQIKMRDYMDRAIDHNMDVRLHVLTLARRLGISHWFSCGGDETGVQSRD